MPTAKTKAKLLRTAQKRLGSPNDYLLAAPTAAELARHRLTLFLTPCAQPKAHGLEMRHLIAVPYAANFSLYTDRLTLLARGHYAGTNFVVSHKLKGYGRACDKLARCVSDYLTTLGDALV